VADVCGAGIGGPICKPQRNVPASQFLGDLYRVKDVIQRLLAHRGLLIAQRAVLVNLVLENVGVDGSCTYAILLGQLSDAIDRAAWWTIPQHMQCQARTAPSHGMDLAGV